MVATASVDLDLLDPEALKALVIAQRAELFDKDVELSMQQEKLSSHEQQIEHLKLVIEKLQRMMFGVKSEKISRQIEQLQLKLEELESAKTAREATQPNLASEAPRARPVRRPLPEHLPREVMTYSPVEDCCPECGGELRRLGEDVSEQLEYIPESFKVIRHVRTK